MLVLSRKKGERICVADNIELTMMSVQGGRVRLGLTAPDSFSINRGEIRKRFTTEHTTTEHSSAPVHGRIDTVAACS